MGHGIKEHDKGYCKGTTWHNMPQYVQQAEAVTLEQALEVFAFEQHIRKLPTFVELGYYNQPSGSYAIVRDDVEKILNPAVGNNYTLVDMSDITKLAYGQIVEAFNGDDTQVEIETVGTLSNGAVQFLSISFDKHYIHGDDSPTKTRLLTTNDYRGGGIKTLLSTIRTVCANTRAWAIQQAMKEGNCKTTRHTAKCNDSVKQLVLDMAQIQVDMMAQRETLDNLAKYGAIKGNQIDAVLDAIYPIKEDAKRTPKNAGKRDAILDCFYDGQDGFTGAYNRTPYAFYQAITNKICREEGRKGVSGDWDNIAGRKAELKEVALKKLVEVCV